jgi:hypothetical protein
MASSDVDRHDMTVNEADEKSSTTEQKRAPESIDTETVNEDRDVEKQQPDDSVQDVDVEISKTDSENGSGEVDPNIVDFDGPNDPHNPMNWSKKRKWLNGGFLSVLTLIT